MNNESKLILEIWDLFRDLLPAPKRLDKAIALLKIFEEYEFDVKKSDLEGEDNYIDEALELFDNDDHSFEEEEEDY